MDQAKWNFSAALQQIFDQRPMETPKTNSSPHLPVFTSQW
jgi:hypothetical protein